MRHVVQFSGGAGSYGAAHRVVERHGPANTTLLCADTLSEADDWKPFIHSAAETLGVELVIVYNEKRLDLWELAEQQNAIPNPRIAFCSRILKRETKQLMAGRLLGRVHLGRGRHPAIDGDDGTGYRR